MNRLDKNIAGAYIGAQVEWTNKKWDIYSYGKDGVQINALVVPYDQCRLILTPLSAISDEDAIEVAKLADYHLMANEDLDLALTGKSIINHMHKRSDIDGITWFNILDYLRSRNYDIGYMGIRSLIDAGIAISSLDKIETK